MKRTHNQKKRITYSMVPTSSPMLQMMSQCVENSTHLKLTNSSLQENNLVKWGGQNSNNQSIHLLTDADPWGGAIKSCVWL
jgi:hypothetical protein